MSCREVRLSDLVRAVGADSPHAGLLDSRIHGKRSAAGDAGDAEQLPASCRTGGPESDCDPKFSRCKSCAALRVKAWVTSKFEGPLSELVSNGSCGLIQLPRQWILFLRHAADVVERLAPGVRRLQCGTAVAETSGQ